MAAKRPAAKKTAKSARSSKTTQAKAVTRKKSGYTAAQRRAYSAASRAAIRRVQVLHNTSVVRARKRLALQKIIGKLRAKGGQRVVTQARAYAARQAYLQAKTYNPADKALVLQRAHALFKAQSIATQKNFAFKGERIHARAYRSAPARRHVRVAAKRKTATKPNPYKSFGAAFGRAAAARLPGPSVAKPKKRKAAKNSPVETSQWITAGNDDSADNCVAVAVANHFLYHTGKRISDSVVNYLRYTHSVDKVLDRIDFGQYWGHEGAQLEEYGMVPLDEVEPGMVVGFKVKNGDHCGLLLPGNKVVSWGEVIPLESEIDEAWSITWTKKGT